MSGAFIVCEDMSREFSKAFYHSKEWKNVRDYCLKRDNYLCTMCGSPAEEVHHIKHLSPENINDVRITLNPDNLTCLCKECHFNEHKQDKADGIAKAKGIPENPYTFDENGMLIKK